MTNQQTTSPSFVWERNPLGGGFTGKIKGQWTAYVLNDGSWTLYKSNNFKHHAAGKSPSVFSAKSMASKAAN